jgi:hypothetical protein
MRRNEKLLDDLNWAKALGDEAALRRAGHTNQLLHLLLIELDEIRRELREARPANPRNSDT